MTMDLVIYGARQFGKKRGVEDISEIYCSSGISCGGLREEVVRPT